jgi:prophage regulatory protein
MTTTAPHASFPIPHRLLRLPAVLELVGLGRSRIYDLVSEGRFPAPVRLSDRAVAWVASEVDEWVQARVDERDAEASSQ